MWIYTRKHSIHKHPRTIHFDSFTIDIDEEGKVLSPVTADMEAVFKKHRAFVFEEPRGSALAQYFASIDAAMAEACVAEVASSDEDEQEGEEAISLEAAGAEEEQPAALTPARGRRKKQ